MCSAGEPAILQPVKLTTYIQQIYEQTKDIEIISKITKKIINSKSISSSEIRNLIKYLNNNNLFNKIEPKPKKENNSSKNYIDILTNKNNSERPSTSIDDIIDNVLMCLAQDKINPILIGPSGVGKSTIINEIAYRITKNEIPDFLKKKKIINLTGLITSKYTEKFENDIKKIIQLCINDNHIIFIDNIHILYDTENSLSKLIKYAITEKGLKVIGITTPDKYKELISSDESNKNFKKIIINEPNEEVLYHIINKTFNDYSKKNKIKLFDEMDTIIKVLINLTEEENRIWNSNNKIITTDIVYNPGLVIGIIDKIFAHAKVNNQKKLEFINLKYGIETCDKITDNKKEVILNAIDTEINIENFEKVFKKYLRLTNPY